MGPGDDDCFVNKKPRGGRGNDRRPVPAPDVLSISAKIDTDSVVQHLMRSLQKVTSGDKEGLGLFENELRDNLNKIVASSIMAGIESTRAEFLTIVDEDQQNRRQMNFCLRGLEEAEGGVTDPHARALMLEKAVVTQINEKVKPTVPLTTDSIVRVRRVGKFDVPKDANKPNPRPVIVTLSKFLFKIDLFRNKKNLKGTGMMITEDLTNARREILLAAFNKFPKPQVWTMNGAVKWNHNGRVHSATKMSEFLEKTAGVPDLPGKRNPKPGPVK